MMTVTDLITKVFQAIDRKPGCNANDYELRVDIGIQATNNRQPTIAFSLDVNDCTSFGRRVLSVTGDTTDDVLRLVKEDLFPSSRVCSEDDLTESLHDFTEQ